MEDLGYKPHGLSWDVIYYIFIPCTEMLRGTLSPFPVLLTRLFFSEGKYLYLSNRPHSATCLHVMAFYVVPSHVRDIKDMAQVRMPFRSWIFWHWELPRIRVSIQTYPNHLLVPMSHVFPVFDFLEGSSEVFEWKLWQAMPQTWIWGSSCKLCMFRDVCRMY